ncbi:hypothetical protein FQJ95_22630, partial [Xanthomonas vasicola]
MNKFLAGALALSVVVAFSMPSNSWAAKKQTGTPAWMNADGEVIKSSDVEAGYGETVKGGGGLRRDGQGR